MLIRTLELLEDIEKMRALRGGRPDLPLTSDPARLCQALDIDWRFDGADLCAPDTLLFLEEDTAISADAVATGPRIGVHRNEVEVIIPWRLYVRDSLHVSH